MSTTTSTTTSTSRRDDGRIPVEVRPGVIVYADPDDGSRMDSADDPGEYRTEASATVPVRLRDGSVARLPASGSRIIAARADADAGPRTRLAAARINARAVADLKLESDYHRRALAANERLVARADAAPAARRDRAAAPAAAHGGTAPRADAARRAMIDRTLAASRGRGVQPDALLRPVPALARSSAAGQTSPASPRRTAPVPSSGAPRFEPDLRLDAAADLTLAEKLAVRHRAASSRSDSAIPDAIAQLRAEKAARERRAKEPPRLTGDARIDAEQASPIAARARHAMIARNLAASKPRPS